MNFSFRVEGVKVKPPSAVLTVNKHSFDGGAGYTLLSFAENKNCGPRHELGVCLHFCYHSFLRGIEHLTSYRIIMLGREMR